jgi:hypothetical protein
MPLSWFRVPRDTSERLKRCRGNNTSDGKFEECVDEIVRDHGGSVVEYRHVGHGRFSQVRIDWPDEGKRRSIVRDLDATEVADPGSERGGDDGGDGSSG